MAINIFLNNLEKEDIKEILKSVIYLIYRKTPLTQEIIVFILELTKYYNFNDDEFEKLFIIDTRYELDIKDTISQLSKESSKMLLFFLVLFAEIFDEIDLDSIYRDFNIYDKLPISPNMQDRIIKATKDYITKTIIMHYFIYDKELPFFVKFTNIHNLVDISNEKYKHFFIIDKKKIDELTQIEKISFLQSLKILMNDDGKISKLEEIVIDLWKYYMGISNIESITLNSKPEIKHLWLKNMLLFSYLITQKNPKKSLENAQKILGISHDNATELLKNVQIYFNSVKELYSLIYSRKLTHIEEDKAKMMDNALQIVEGLLMLLPQTTILKLINGANVLRKAIGEALDVQSRCKTGPTLLQHSNSIKLIIVIDGFLSEEEDKEFDDWMDSLKKLYPNDTIVGFSWKAQNYNTIINGGFSTWYKAVSKTLDGANRLSQYILEQKDINPNIKITLMGHSLGARVIFNTLYRLLDSCQSIDNIILLGGAVDSNIVNWTDVSESVKNIYNFYSQNDYILKTLYQIAMADRPIGLNSIETLDMKGIKKAKIYNYDVSDIINGHNEYKPKLYKLLTEYNVNI